MDYEKAYKEALGRAKSFQEKFGGDYAGYIFPELKESEDERIRKTLVKLISDIDGGYPFEKYGILKKDALAYLEKQKDLPTDEEMKATLRMEYEKGRADAIAETSPAEWSVEDYKTKRNLMSLLTNLRVNGKITEETYQKYYPWLKSPRPQSNWKHLSEKDTFIRDRCYATIRDSELSDEEKEWIFDFLKRCEPQPHWKPSEEQMQALVVAIDESVRCDEPYWRHILHGVLLGLHDDLKKLL